MSLKEELQKLDYKTMSIAVGNVVARTAFEPNGGSEIGRQLVDNQPTLAALPDAIGNTITAIQPGIDEQQMMYFRMGMTALASVLCEYADLEDMQAQFPDMSPEA